MFGVRNKFGGRKVQIKGLNTNEMVLLVYVTQAYWVVAPILERSGVKSR